MSIPVVISDLVAGLGRRSGVDSSLLLCGAISLTGSHVRPNCRFSTYSEFLTICVPRLGAQRRGGTAAGI